MCTQEFSTALNRWRKHNGQSARRCRWQKPDAAQSSHTINSRSASGQSSSSIEITTQCCWHIIYAESSPGRFADSVSFCWHSVFFCWIRSFRWLVNFLLIHTIFCSVIVMYLCWLTKFADTVYFAESADFCWYSKFCFLSCLLLCHHQAFW